MPFVCLQPRHRPAGQTPFLAYLSFPSSLFALLRSMVGEERIFSFLVEAGDTRLPGSSPSMSIAFSWIFYFFE